MNLWKGPLENSKIEQNPGPSFDLNPCAPCINNPDSQSVKVTLLFSRYTYPVFFPSGKPETCSFLLEWVLSNPFIITKDNYYGWDNNANRRANWQTNWKRNNKQTKVMKVVKNQPYISMDKLTLYLPLSCILAYLIPAKKTVPPFASSLTISSNACPRASYPCR